MKEKGKYKVKDIILLDDNRKYSIIKKVNEYYILLSVDEPLKIMIVKITNDKILVETDKKIIEEVLSI